MSGRQSTLEIEMNMIMTECWPFSQANQLRLQNALASLQSRRAQAEEQGDWEAAATCTRAMQEIEALRDIA